MSVYATVVTALNKRDLKLLEQCEMKAATERQRSLVFSIVRFSHN